MSKKSTEKQQIIDEFIQLREQFQNETGSYDISRDYYRENAKNPHRYEKLGLTFSQLKQYHKPQNPKQKTSSKNNRKIKRYLVSAIVPRAINNKEFINALLRYCTENDAELLLVPIKGVNGEVLFDEYTKEDYGRYFCTYFSFNENLKLINPGITANNTLSLTTIQRKIHDDKSYIIPCTRQKMEITPRISSEVSFIYTTGTVSMPDYKCNQTGYFNEVNNVLGALVIEVYDDYNYNVRNLRWINKCFVDLNKMYHEGRTMTVRPTALVAGDFHIGGDEDIEALKATKEQLLFLKPKMLVVHDLASHNTINHHIKDKTMTRAKNLQESGILTLEDEHRYIAKFIAEYAKDIPEITWKIVASNHNEWLKKYLDGKQGNHDIFNEVYNCKLRSDFYAKNIDVFEGAILYHLLKFNKKVKINFLTRKDHLIVGGYELAMHGDKGNSGSKGSLFTHELSAKKCVIGHSHSPRIGTVGYQVGTNSKLELNYTAGSGNNWAHANCAVYDELGQVQMILTLNGRWK